MKKRLIKIIALLLFISLMIGLNKGLKLSDSTVRAVGDLSVDWGVPEGQPIYQVADMAPGQSEQRDVIVENSASTIRPVGARGIKTDELSGLADKLLLTISLDGADLYGGGAGEKTLRQFFDESSGPDGVMLFNLNPGVAKTLVFDVLFDTDAGNEYQSTSVVFDLRIGIAIHIPGECLGIVFKNDPIFGTAGNDRIRGTNGNDLIYGFEGNDNIQSSNGDDCAVGGPGNDRINNSNGNDIIYGNEGDDRLYGSNGNDVIYGGDGQDMISGSNGSDRLYGEADDDTIYGSNGDDLIDGGGGDDYLNGSNGNDNMMGGEGNDMLLGGNNNDNLSGDDGDDIIKGGNGNDNLVGGLGLDSINGETGFDQCDAEVKTKCEI